MSASSPNIHAQRHNAALSAAATRRWARTSQADKTAHMAHARAGMLAKAIRRATEQTAVLGIELTPEQAEQAGRRLLKTEQAARAAMSRATRDANLIDRKKAADTEWAMRQAHVFADKVKTWDPTVPEKDIFRIVLMAVADELTAPDGLQRPRCIKRLKAYVDAVKQAAAQRSVELAQPWDLDAISLADLLNGGAS